MARRLDPAAENRRQRRQHLEEQLRLLDEEERYAQAQASTSVNNTFERHPIPGSFRGSTSSPSSGSRQTPSSQPTLEPPSLEQVHEYLIAHNQAKGLNTGWAIDGHRLDVYRMFAEVVNKGGSRNITRLGQWSNIAESIGVPPTFRNGELVHKFFAGMLSRLESMWDQTKPPARSTLGSALDKPSVSPNSASLVYSAPHQVIQRGNSIAKRERNTVVTNGATPSSNPRVVKIPPRPLPIQNAQAGPSRIPLPHQPTIASLLSPSSLAPPGPNTSQATPALTKPAKPSAKLAAQPKDNAIAPPVAQPPVTSFGPTQVTDFHQLVSSNILPLPRPGPGISCSSAGTAADVYARRCQELRSTVRKGKAGQPNRQLTPEELHFWGRLVNILTHNPGIVIPDPDRGAATQQNPPPPPKPPQPLPTTISPALLFKPRPQPSPIPLTSAPTKQPNPPAKRPPTDTPRDSPSKRPKPTPKPPQPRQPRNVPSPLQFHQTKAPTLTPAADFLHLTNSSPSSNPPSASPRIIDLSSTTSLAKIRPKDLHFKNAVKLAKSRTGALNTSPTARVEASLSGSLRPIGSPTSLSKNVPSKSKKSANIAASKLPKANVGAPPGNLVVAAVVEPRPPRIRRLEVYVEIPPYPLRVRRTLPPVNRAQVVIPVSKRRRRTLLGRGFYDAFRDDYSDSEDDRPIRTVLLEQPVKPEPIPDRFWLRPGPGLVEPWKSLLSEESLLKRPQPRACEWKGCEAILASEWHLVRHIDARQHALQGKFTNGDEYLLRCHWHGCRGPSFSTPERLVQHLHATHTSKDLACPFASCSLSSPNISHLSRHVTRNHTSIDDHPRPLVDLSQRPSPREPPVLPVLARTDELTTPPVPGSTYRTAYRREWLRNKVLKGSFAGDDPVIHVDHPPHMLQPLDYADSIAARETPPVMRRRLIPYVEIPIRKRMHWSSED